MTTTEKGRPERAWLVMALCFTMEFVCLGFCSSNKSLYLAAITDALKIKRSLFSISDSCRFVCTAVVNLFLGRLISKFGIRKLIGAGFLCLILSCLLNSVADTVFVFYAGGCLLGIGLAWTTTAMVTLIISRRFHRNRGRMMGFVLAANGLGGVFAAQVISPVIYGTDPFGYRAAYRMTAVILLCAGIAVVALTREPPAAPQSEPAEKRSARTLPQAAGPAAFGAASVCIFLTGMALQAVSGITAAHLRDVGFDAAFIANVLSIHAVALALFKFLSGVCYDTFGLRITMLLCDAAAVISIAILGNLTDPAAGCTLAMIFGILVAAAMPLETVVIPLIALELSDEKSYARMLGLLFSINSAGFALGTPLTNFVYDRCGTYRPALLVLSGMMAVVAAAFQLILRTRCRLRSSCG